MSPPSTHLLTGLAILCLTLVAATAYMVEDELDAQELLLGKRAQTGGPHHSKVKLCDRFKDKRHSCKRPVQCERAKYDYCLNNCDLVYSLANSKTCEDKEDRWTAAVCTKVKKHGGCNPRSRSRAREDAPIYCAKTCGLCVSKQSTLHCIAETGFMCKFHRAGHSRCGNSKTSRCQTLAKEVAACDKHDG